MIRWALLLAVLLVVWRIVRSQLAPRTAPPHAPSVDSHGDPYAVLGIGRGASDAEIAHAYRERMMEYHPDRVATLGPELRELAHRKTLEIQRAWTTLRRK